VVCVECVLHGFVRMCVCGLCVYVWSVCVGKCLYFVCVGVLIVCMFMW